MDIAMNGIRNKIDFFLYKRGFTDPVLRSAIFSLLALSAVSVPVGLGMLIWNTNGLMFAVGCIIMAWNFWSLSRFIFVHFFGEYSRELVRGQIFRFMGRFIVSGIVLALCFVLGGSAWAISAGLIASLFVMLVTVLLANRGA